MCIHGGVFVHVCIRVRVRGLGCMHACVDMGASRVCYIFY